MQDDSANAVWGVGGQGDNTNGGGEGGGGRMAMQTVGVDLHLA